MDIYAGKDCIVIWRDNVRGGYDRVEGSIGRSYDEIKGMTMSMSRNFLMLNEITIGEKVEKLDCLSIAEVVEKLDWLSIAEVVDMDVKVAGNDEFMRGDGCMGKKRWELVMKGKKRLRVWWWREW